MASLDDYDPEDDSGTYGALSTMGGGVDPSLYGGAFGKISPEDAALPDYLKNAYGKGQALLDQSSGALSNYEQQAIQGMDAKKAAIQAGLDKLLAQKPDHSALLLALASGLLSPTKTGRFGESLGQAGAAAVPQVVNEQQRGDTRDLNVLKYQLENAGVDSDTAKLQLDTALKRAQLGRGLMSDVDKLQNSRLLMLGRQQASVDAATARAQSAKDLASLRADLAKTPAQREAAQLFPDDPDKQAQYIAQKSGVILPGSGGGTPGDAAPTGDDFLKSLNNEGLANQVKAIAEGRQAPPGQGKQKQQILELVNKYDPSFDASQLPVRTATMKDLTSGQGSKNIAAFNTAIRHMSEINDAFDKLHNSGVPLVSKPYNWVANQVEGEGPIADFNSAKNAVATELAKAYRGAGSLNESEVKEWSDALSSSASPEQQRAVMGRLAKLLEGRIDTIRSQAEQNLGPVTSKNIYLLDPKNQEILDYFKQRAAGRKVVRPGTPKKLTDAEAAEKKRLEDELNLGGGDQ